MAIEVQVKNRTFLIPQQKDPCVMWVAYFKKLKKEVGTDNARTLWLLTWGSSGSSTCTTGADFNRFLKKNHIDVSTAATRAIADTAKIGSNILGMGKELTRMLSIGVPITLGVVVIAIVVVLLRTAKQSKVSDLVALTPAGRVGSLAKIMKGAGA